MFQFDDQEEESKFTGMLERFVLELRDKFPEHTFELQGTKTIVVDNVSHQLQLRRSKEGPEIIEFNLDVDFLYEQIDS